MVIVLFNNLLSSAWDFEENETLAGRIRPFVQHLPSFFELLWYHRFIVFGDTRSEVAGSDVLASPLSLVQSLVGHYCMLHGSDLLHMYVSQNTQTRLIYMFALGLHQWSRSDSWSTSAFIAGTTLPTLKGIHIACQITSRQFWAAPTLTHQDGVYISQWR